VVSQNHLRIVMVEGNPEKSRVWLQINQRKPRKMIGVDARGVKCL